MSSQERRHAGLCLDSSRKRTFGPGRNTVLYDYSYSFPVGAVTNYCKPSVLTQIYHLIVLEVRIPKGSSYWAKINIHRIAFLWRLLGSHSIHSPWRIPFTLMTSVSISAPRNFKLYSCISNSSTAYIMPPLEYPYTP